MILKESELDDSDIIRPIIGKPYKEPGKLLTATGSTIYFVKELTDLEGNPLPLKKEEMKAIFQRYEKGMILYLTKSNYQNAILISEKSVKKITLFKNIEERAFTNKLLLKCLLIISDLPILGSIAKLFIYKARETILRIETDFFKAKMITSFSSFDSQFKYFSLLGYGNKIEAKV